MAQTLDSRRYAGGAAPQIQAVTGLLTWSALVVALVGLAGSLWLSIGMHLAVGSLAVDIGMNLKACPLCFYQRTFVMSILAVLVTGLIIAPKDGGRISLLALPLATAGLGVALFHVSLELREKLDCPRGIFDWGAAPKQGLALFAVLFCLLAVAVLRNWQQGVWSWPAPLGAVVLGAVLAGASCIANPPLPPTPKEPYTKAPDICRPPFPESRQ